MSKKKILMAGNVIETEKEMRERHPTDFYPTDPKLVAMIIKHIVNWDLGEVATVLDPGAGQGVWGQALLEAMPNAEITGVEFTREPPAKGYAHWIGDTRYQDWGTEQRFDIIMGNPPFSQAEEFIVRSIPLLRDGNSIIVFLLKTAFLHSIKRARGLWDQYPPSRVYHLAKRPSFLGDGSSATDDQEYSIYEWRGYEITPFPRPNKRHWWISMPFDWTKLWNEQYGTQGAMAFVEGTDDE